MFSEPPVNERYEDEIQLFNSLRTNKGVFCVDFYLNNATLY